MFFCFIQHEYFSHSCFFSVVVIGFSCSETINSCNYESVRRNRLWGNQSSAQVTNCNLLKITLIDIGYLCRRVSLLFWWKGFFAKSNEYALNRINWKSNGLLPSSPRRISNYQFQTWFVSNISWVFIVISNVWHLKLYILWWKRWIDEMFAGFSDGRGRRL